MPSTGPHSVCAWLSSELGNSPNWSCIDTGMVAFWYLLSWNQFCVLVPTAKHYVVKWHLYVPDLGFTGLWQCTQLPLSKSLSLHQQASPLTASTVFSSKSKDVQNHAWHSPPPLAHHRPTPAPLASHVSIEVHVTYTRFTEVEHIVGSSSI